MAHSMHRDMACSACGDLDGCHLPGALASGRLSLEQFWEVLANWSQRTFGADAVRGPTGPLKHLAKEVQECLDAPADVAEYADLLFLVFDATRRAGFGYAELVKAVNEKMRVNIARKWPAPSSDEPVEHIREGS